MLLSPCVADLGWLLWWVCGLCDFCSFVFCVVHAGMNDDALFVWLLFVLVVCSLLRAHGGCLGMLSR